MWNVSWLGRRRATLPRSLGAAPQWLERVAHPATREALAQLPHIRYRLGSQAYPIRFADGTDLLPEGALDTDSGQAMRIAALGGVGIAQLLRLAVADDLAAGRLVEIFPHDPLASVPVQRSEEHTSELQSLMRISYAVFCLKKKTQVTTRTPITQYNILL